MATRRPRGDDAGEDYDDDDIPLHRKQAFGSGLKRTKVEFVKARDVDESAAMVSARRDNASAIGDLYASVVLSSDSKSTSATDTPKDEKEYPICALCSNPITGTVAQHNASLAHQVSLEHSHPPSSLDRSRMGLRALEAHGWDPDARIGLGAEGDGLRFPIKVAAKDDTLGIGAVAPDSGVKPEQPKTLSAKEMRAQVERERKKAEKLQSELYGRVDVERYLRGDGGGGS